MSIPLKICWPIYVHKNKLKELNKMNHTLSISIVTYNNVTEISRLLDPIKDCPDIDIYIIDNHSSDGTSNLIKERYPHINILSNKQNVGFGTAHNKIINQLTSQYHIFVNPDIVITAKTLVEVVNFMDNHKDVSAMSPKVLNFDKTEQYLPKKRPAIRFMIGGFLERICSRFSSLRDNYTMKHDNISNCIDIDFCTGCFFVTRTSYIKKINGFDKRYFLYFEDADLTRELQELGRTVYNPNIEVFHEWKRDSSKSFTLFLISLKSMIQYFNKWGWKI